MENGQGVHVETRYNASALDKALKIGLLLGVFSIAVTLWKYSENGRYQYFTSQNGGVIVDTRTGEFWSWDGNRFAPRKAQITFRHPSVFDLTKTDDQANKFRDCLDYVVNHPNSGRDCRAEQTFASKSTQVEQPRQQDGKTK